MYKNKIIITIVIAILCVMLFSVRVFAENTTTGEDVEGKNTEEKITLNDVIICSNGSKAYGDIKVNLVLGEHETETLWIDIQNIKEEDAKNIQVEWTSSNPSIVTVEQDTGVLKAIKEGSAMISATVEGGISGKCEVTVLPKPQFTDFSNAKYEIVFEHENTNLKISGITPMNRDYCKYYYMITSSATKPTLSSYKDVLIIEDSEFEHNIFEVNTKENYIYFDDGTDRKLDRYLELNQDLYLWVIQQVEFNSSYTTEDGMRIGEATKFVVEGKKLERPQLKLNQIISGMTLYNDYTCLGVNYPVVTENRKCIVKIGQVTDYEILKKIQNNDYSGTSDLLKYAKENQAIHESMVLLNGEGHYSTKESLLDGKALLKDDAYYYVYLMLDDEEGKYYPVEGIILGQADVAVKDGEWKMLALGDNNFKWSNLTDSNNEMPDENEEQPEDKNEGSVDSVEKNDQTTAGTKIPHAGEKNIISVILIIILASIVIYKKLKKFKDII